MLVRIVRFMLVRTCASHTINSYLSHIIIWRRMDLRFLKPIFFSNVVVKVLHMSMHPINAPEKQTLEIKTLWQLRNPTFSISDTTFDTQLNGGTNI